MDAMPAIAVKKMTKRRHNPQAHFSRNAGEDQMQDVAAADELIAGDDHVRNNDGDGGQHASSGVVARFKQIGNGELRKMAGAACDSGN